MKNTVTEEEAGEFNPDLGPCCDRGHFRLHLEGTTCDRWNKSAVRVFVDDFLSTHHDYPSHEEMVTKMVEMKTRATVDSMIRDYRKLKEVGNQAKRDENQARKNRRERQRKVSSVTFLCSTCAPILMNHPSFITAVATSRSYIHPLNTIVHFWNSSRPPACPATKRRKLALSTSTKSTSQSGGRISSLRG